MLLQQLELGNVDWRGCWIMNLDLCFWRFFANNPWWLFPKWWMFKKLVVSGSVTHNIPWWFACFFWGWLFVPSNHGDYSINWWILYMNCWVVAVSKLPMPYRGRLLKKINISEGWFRHGLSSFPRFFCTEIGSYRSYIQLSPIKRIIFALPIPKIKQIRYQVVPLFLMVSNPTRLWFHHILQWCQI